MKKKRSYRENWMERKWRPLMGWMYFAVCITDFMLFPVVWSAFMAAFGDPLNVWNPLTLQGGGLFHVAMGAVLGVAAWTRGQEKIVRYQQGYTHDEDDNDTEVVSANTEISKEDSSKEFYRFSK